jgi:hypothetical protein
LLDAPHDAQLLRNDDGGGQKPNAGGLVNALAQIGQRALSNHHEVETPTTRRLANSAMATTGEPATEATTSANTATLYANRDA